MLRQLRLPALLALVVTFAACNSDTGPIGGGQITFSVATTATASARAAGLMAAAPESIAVGTDTLVLDQVQLVLRKIELERVESSLNCDDAQVEHGENDEQEDDCEEVEAGPIVLDLPLGAGASRQFTVSVDTGTYHEVHFQLHRLTDDPADQALLQDHPELDGASLRVTGTFNGTAFSFTSDLTANQHADLVPPLVVGDATPAQLTLLVELDHWFLNAGGTGLIDPATALQGQPNEQLVRDNIRASFKAFEDEDHDGHDDHEDEPGDDHGNDG